MVARKPKAESTVKTPKSTKSTAAPKATAIKTADSAEPATATIVETVTPVVTGLPIKKPELIDRVVTETGMKKKDVKPVVEAMLGVLGRMLADGEELVVPPLGKVMIKRVRDLPNAKVMTLKLRYPTGAAAPKPNTED